MAIDLTKAWVDHAVLMGAQRVMINQGAQGGADSVMPTHENKVYSIPALKAMADYGKSKGIIVSVETRGGGGGGRGRGAAPGTAAAGNAPGAPLVPHRPRLLAQHQLLPRPQRLRPRQLQRRLLRRQCRHPRSGRCCWKSSRRPAPAPTSMWAAPRAKNQEELHQCLKMLFPVTAGTMHTRVNAAWDLATAIKFLEHDLGYKGLYTIEASNGHEGTQPIYDVVVATV